MHSRHSSDGARAPELIDWLERTCELSNEKHLFKYIDVLQSDHLQLVEGIRSIPKSSLFFENNELRRVSQFQWRNKGRYLPDFNTDKHIWKTMKERPLCGRTNLIFSLSLSAHRHLIMHSSSQFLFPLLSIRSKKNR